MRRSIVPLVLSTGCVPHLECADAKDGLPLGCAVPWVAPENGYAKHTPPADLVAEGMGVGEVAFDVRGIDQHGDTVSLWQFYGDVIVFDVSTMWCRPCQQLAIGTEDIAAEFADHGFTYVTALLQDVQGGDLTVDELAQWAALPASDANGAFDAITAPIVADQQGAGGSADAVRNNLYPAVLLLGRDMRVLRRVEPVSHEAVHDAVAEELAK